MPPLFLRRSLRSRCRGFAPTLRVLGLAFALVVSGRAADSSETDAASGVTLTGETSRPETSTFALGEKVELVFRVARVEAGPPFAKLRVSIVDEQDQPVSSREFVVKPDAEGDWSTRMDAPAAKLGFYRVHAKLSHGVQLPALGSRQPGYLTYIVVPDPAGRTDYGEAASRFGLRNTPSQLCPLLGSRWLLDESLFWKRREPDRAGQFGAEEIEAYVAKRNPGTAGFRVSTVPSLFRVPMWAVVPGTHSYETGTLTPDGERAWGEFCKAAARASMERNPDRARRIYEITNEPIQPWGFKGTDADLVRIYEIAYESLHAVDPKAVVAGPCRGLWRDGDPEATVRLLKLGLGKYLDAYLAHPFYSLTPEQDGMPEAIRTMKEILRGAAGKELPMVGTSQGLPTDEKVSMELEQARAAMRQNLITLGEGFEFNLVFNFHDFRMAGSRSGYGYYYNLVDAVPFGPRKVGPKPVAAAFAAQSFLLEGSTSRGAIEWLGNGVLGYAFERPDGVTLAVWNHGGPPRTVSIPTGVKRVRVFDWMGNGRTMETAAGALELELGPEPVYVGGVAAKIWGGEAADLLRVDSTNVQGFPGGKVSIAGTSRMTADQPFPGTLTLEDPAGVLQSISREARLGSEAAASFRFEFGIPSALPLGVHALLLRLKDSVGHTLRATAITLDVLAPLEIRTKAVFTGQGNPALAVTLDETRGDAVDGRLEVRVLDPAGAKDVSGATGHASFEIPARGSRRVVVDFPDADLEPARTYRAVVSVATTGGIVFSQNTPVHFLGAAHPAHPPTIDGDLSEWAAIRPVVLSGARDAVRAPELCPKNLAAKLRYAWDEGALYLAAEVNDDAFVQNNTDAKTWSQDCLQLAFNLDPGIPSADTGNRRTSEINVALTKNGPEAFRSHSHDFDTLPPGNLSADRIRLAIRNDGAGRLFYEMAIPWTSLGAASGETFESGGMIGVAATVNDVRDVRQGDPSALGLFGGITPDKNPDRHGVLILN